jgi:hypothetical protein
VKGHLTPGQLETWVTTCIAAHVGHPARVFGGDFADTRPYSRKAKWNSLAGDMGLCKHCCHPVLTGAVHRHWPETTLRPRALGQYPAPLRGLSVADYGVGDPFV